MKEKQQTVAFPSYYARARRIRSGLLNRKTLSSCSGTGFSDTSNSSTFSVGSVTTDSSKVPSSSPVATSTTVDLRYPKISETGPTSNVGSRCIGLTFSRRWLVHISEETLQIAKEGRYMNTKGQTVHVKDALRNSIRDSVHYHSSHIFYPPPEPTSRIESTTFHVCYGSSLQVAAKLEEELQRKGYRSFSSSTAPTSTPAASTATYHIGILNSASGKNPDKFLRGTLSQEEGLCRASFLYPCLIQYRDRPHHFYHVNRKPKYQESSSSCAIYCPHVPIIRHDDGDGHDGQQGTLLDSPKYFSIVSIPSPNAFVLGDGSRHTDGSGGNNSENDIAQTLGGHCNSDIAHGGLVPKAQAPGASDRNETYETMTLDEAMRDRIYRALSIFAEQGCTDLVLCAFGCGVHGNNPTKIAMCFKEMLSSPSEEAPMIATSNNSNYSHLRGVFRNVTFAIQRSRTHNYNAFATVFSENAGSSNSSDHHYRQ